MEEKLLEVSKRTNQIEFKNLKRGSIIEVEIADLVFGGKGLARIETEFGKFIVFVPNAIPGQVIRAKVIKRQKNHAEARTLKVLKNSHLEGDIPYQLVSGAPYARLPLDIQHSYKKRNTLDQFKRISKIENIEDYLDEFIVSPENWHYRNKMEFNFSSILWNIGDEKSKDGFGLGFKKHGCWWAVENLDKSSGLFDRDFEEKLKEIREYFISTGLMAYHPIKHEGFYRIFQIKKSYFDNSFLINLSTTLDGVERFSLKDLYNFLSQLFPNRVTGLIHSINDSVSDRMSLAEQQKEVIGDPFIIEKINGLEFQINSYSFFQTNPKSAEVLYSKVIDYVFDDEIKGEILDLFCGTGTIAQLIAQKHTMHLITGVELVKQAVEDAKKNADRNEVSNVKFIAADVGDFLKEHPDFVNKIEVVVLDPPRGGISKKALKGALRLNARKMIYVSCNPSTQARDMLLLKEFGYELKKLTIVDQFPHTSHIETIALFHKK